jgi:hypothetical protein
MSSNKLDLLLTYFCKDNGWTLEREFLFDPNRRWRSDFYIPELNCLIEYEGLVASGKGGHQTMKAYTNNCDKYNRASLLGFKLLRYTALNFRNVEFDLNELK